jgi:hypothetical protein
MIGSFLSTKKIPTTHLKQRITHEKIENEKIVIDKKTGLVKVSGMVEQVVARWERPTMVVVIAQGEILGTEDMIKMKIGKNEKMGLGERE